jgi:hypothetical protein
MFFFVKIAIPDPTPVSPLLPSVYASTECLISSCAAAISTTFGG